MEEVSRVLIMIGSVILFIGVLLFLIDKVPYVGKLPGDFIIKTKIGITFYLPLTTSLIVSLILTIVFSVFRIGK